MRVSNPLLSNHTSCITVGDCVVLVVFALQRHVETRVSRQTNSHNLKRNPSVTVIETAPFACKHASLNLICTAFY